MNKEELDLLESVFTLAIGECAYNDINNIQKLEYKIKTINNLCKKQKEVIDRILSETKETRNILNNNRDNNMLSESCLLSYLEIVEDLLNEVSE